jgi:Lon protease-like protein
MVTDAIHHDEGFGVVSNLENRISEIGCYVKVDEVIKSYDNGSMDIIVKGYDRFKILNKDVTIYGYYEATIIPYFDEESVLVNDINVIKLIDIFKDIVEYSQLSLSDNYWRNLSNTNLKSFKIAEKCGLTLNQQQDLLVLRNENERIEYLMNHFDRLNKYIENTNEVKNLMMNDGYLN